MNKDKSQAFHHTRRTKQYVGQWSALTLQYTCHRGTLAGVQAGVVERQSACGTLGRLACQPRGEQNCRG